jgi:hypothetical protein
MLTADLWSVFLHTTVALVKRDLRDQGKKVQTYSKAELTLLAKARLWQECEEWLARNRP